MAALDAAALREHITTGLSDTALGLLGTAAWEAITQAVGDEGAITEIHDGGGTYLFLTRPAATFTSIKETIGSTITTLAANDYRTDVNGMSIRRLATGDNPQNYWQGTVEVIYTPTDDEAQRQVAQIALVELFLNHHPGLQAETIGDWQEQFQSNSAWNYALERDAILSTLRAPVLGFA
jgi:hypothetical protein